MKPERKNMSTATYAGLRAASRAGSPKPDDMETTAESEDEAEDAEAEPKAKKKEKEYMTEAEANAAIADATAKAKADERARFASVMASEEYAGRETLAATLLGNDKLSADEIVTALAAAPKAAAPAATTTENDEEAARAEMRQNLAAEQPASTGQAAEDEPQADDSLVNNMKARFGLAK
jgi:hypothetical protein